MQIEELEWLHEAATPGSLIACGWGDGSTQMGMTNIFNEDAEVLLAECLPQEDAALIAYLWNNRPDIIATYRERDSYKAALEGIAEFGHSHPGYGFSCAKDARTALERRGSE